MGMLFFAGLINLWSYFWRRSFPIQFLLLALVTAAGAGIFFFFQKGVSRFFDNMTKKEKANLIVSLSVVSMVSVIILFPFTELSRTFRCLIR